MTAELELIVVTFGRFLGVLEMAELGLMTPEKSLARLQEVAAEYNQKAKEIGQ